MLGSFSMFHHKSRKQNRLRMLIYSILLCVPFLLPAAKLSVYLLSNLLIWLIPTIITCTYLPIIILSKSCKGSIWRETFRTGGLNDSHNIKLRFGWEWCLPLKILHLIYYCCFTSISYRHTIQSFICHS
jgi:hypothetical protein